MTLAQLQSFVLVARHGSVKAAAAELEVTEPAVSVAVSALKQGAGRRAVRAQRPRDRADAGRAAARGAGDRDPRAGRAGAPVGGRVGRRDAPAVRARDAAGRRAHRPADRALHGPRRGAGDHGRRRQLGARSPRRSSTAAPTSRSARRRAPPPRPSPPPRSCAAASSSSPRRRTRWRAARAIAPGDAGRRALAGRPARARSRRGHRQLPRPPRAGARAASRPTAAAPPPIAAAVAGEGIMLVALARRRRRGQTARARAS